jgi:endonuclease YncB( thermonuclease family)
MLVVLVSGRNAEQAKRMKVDAGEIVKWGKKAKKFTEKFLDDEFTVWTKKEDARGRSKRYYALISKEVDGRTVWLHQELLLNGLARAYGRDTEFRNSEAKAYWDKSREFSNDCRNKQGRARQAKVGIWKGREEDEFEAIFGSN